MQRSLRAALGATVVILAACGTATSSTPPAEPTVGTSLPATAPPGAPAVTTPPATPATPAIPAATAVPRPAGTLAWPTGFAVEMANATYFTSPPFVVPLTITIAEPGWHAGHLNPVFIDLQRYDGVEVGGLPTRMLAFGWPENVRGADGAVPVAGLTPEAAVDLMIERGSVKPASVRPSSSSASRASASTSTPTSGTTRSSARRTVTSGSGRSWTRASWRCRSTTAS